MFLPHAPVRRGQRIQFRHHVPLSKEQVRALGADVVRLHHTVARHFPLDREGPLLVLRVVVSRQRRSRAASQERKCVPARGIGQTHRKWIAECRVLCPPAVERPRNARVREAERRPDLAFYRVAGHHVEEAPGGPDRGLAIQRVGEADPRLPVVVVALVRRAVVAVREPHQPVQPAREERLELRVVGERRGRAPDPAS